MFFDLNVQRPDFSKWIGPRPTLELPLSNLVAAMFVSCLLWAGLIFGLSEFLKAV